MNFLGYKVKLFGGGMRKVNLILPFCKGKNVLDIGVVAHRREAYKDKNWLHKNLANVAKKCVGIDIDKHDVEYLCTKGYNVRNADAQNFQLNEKFDVIVAGDIIEHLHDFHGFFLSIEKHLQPTSTLIITTANPWFFVRIFQAFFQGRVYENPEHTLWFTIGTLTELLKRNGFSVLQAEYVSSEEFLYRFFFLPKIVRHAGFFIVAQRENI